MICTVKDCATKVRCKGLCELHYDRMRRLGTTEIQERPTQCTTQDCEAKVIGHGLCEKHYRKHKISQSVTCCSMPDCDRPSRARGWCSMHYSRWKEHGSVEWQPRGVNTYGSMHYKITADRGQASRQTCIGCGDSAQEWSYDHADPHERRDVDDSAQRPYSLDVGHYQPRCIHCHRNYDLANSSNSRTA